MNLNIHQITSITIDEVFSFEKTPSRDAFSVRHLKITDANGNVVTLDLFSDDAKALTIHADWNQGQSITL